MRSIQRFAPAKLNLYLHVTGRRADGYHELDSLVVFADVGDRIAVAKADDVRLEISGPFASELTDAGPNLVLKAAHALASASEASGAFGARIGLEKNLPVASGLGGGSSDAAAALLALAELWRLRGREIDLDRIAADLGADMPVCLKRRPQIVAGIGEVLRNAPRLPPFALVLVNPGVKLATADVFSGLAGPFRALNPLARSLPDFPALLEALKERGNDLEAPALKLAPPIADVLTALERQGAALARMSGSGATCFGLFRHQAAAKRAAQAIRQAHPLWWVRTCGLYRDA